MALPSSGAISASDIRTEFGLSGSLSFNDLYRGANGDGTIKDNYGENNNIPTSGAIDFQDFYDVYLEGDIDNKLSSFNTYRSSGLVTTGLESGESVVTNTGSYHPVRRTLTVDISLLMMFQTRRTSQTLIQ